MSARSTRASPTPTASRKNASLLDLTHGHRPGEVYQIARPTRPFLEEVGTDPGHLRIAMVVDTPAGGTPLHPQIRQAVIDTGAVLESLGHHVEPRPVPYDYWPLMKAYTNIIATQTAAFFDAVAPLVGRAATRADMAPFFWSLCDKGRSFSGVEHSNHVEQVRMASRACLARMAAWDVWLMPTLPMLPRVHGYYDMTLDCDTYDDTLMAPDCCYTLPFNAMGSPAISLPLGMSSEGLPVGVQLVVRDCDEAGLLRLAAQLEVAMPWAQRRPRGCWE